MFITSLPKSSVDSIVVRGVLYMPFITFVTSLAIDFSLFYVLFCNMVTCLLLKTMLKTKPCFCVAYPHNSYHKKTEQRDLRLGFSTVMQHYHWKSQGHYTQQHSEICVVFMTFLFFFICMWHLKWIVSLYVSSVKVKSAATVCLAWVTQHIYHSVAHVIVDLPQDKHKHTSVMKGHRVQFVKHFI